MTPVTLDTSPSNNTDDDNLSPTERCPFNRFCHPQEPRQYVKQVDNLAKDAYDDMRPPTERSQVNLLHPPKEPGQYVKQGDNLAKGAHDGMWSPTDHFGFKPLHPPKERGQYVKQVDDLAEGARPDLRFLAKELKRLRHKNDTNIGKVAVLKFSNDSAAPEKSDLNKETLQMDLENSKTDRVRRLYILEDISNEYVEIFGFRLNLDPSFFARHLRVTRWESSSRGSNAPPLPSTINSAQSFSLRYPELVVFPPWFRAYPKKDNEDKRSYFCDCHLYREITMARLPARNFPPDRVGVIRRKLSFWSSKHDDDNAWVGEL